MPRRLAKAIADAGVCSRREAERRIEDGRVTLNGDIQTSPAINVGSADKVTVDGRPIKWQDKPLRLFAYNKPTGVVCSNTDPEGRPTVFDSLPKNTPRLVLVGRLDLNSEGLLLLTTSGEFAGELMHPKNQISRVYKVRFRGDLTPETVAAMAAGPEIDGVNYRPVEVKLSKTASTADKQRRANQWAEVRLYEGKNREIRKVFEHFGLQVNRLIRLSYGGVSLGDLPTGKLMELHESTAKSLQKQLTDKGK